MVDGRLLTFFAFKVGAYSSWALTRGCANSNKIRVNAHCGVIRRRLGTN